VRDWTPEKSVADMTGRRGHRAHVDHTRRSDFLTMRRRSWPRVQRLFGKLVADGKGRFGMFAVMPMPHVDATLHEIAYALDTLKADGIACSRATVTSGWAIPLSAVMEELNRRQAVVYTIHTELLRQPSSPTCRTRSSSGARTHADDRQPGLQRHRRQVARVKFISPTAAARSLPHERFVRLPLINKDSRPRPNGVEHELKRFYYDTAQAPIPTPWPPSPGHPDIADRLRHDYPYRTAADH